MVESAKTLQELARVKRLSESLSDSRSREALQRYLLDLEADCDQQVVPAHSVQRQTDFL